MSTTNFGQGHAAQAQEAPVRGSGDGCRLRSRSVDASAKVGNRRPTPVRYPKGQESTLATEIELRNVTLAKTTNLTQDRTENLTHVRASQTSYCSILMWLKATYSSKKLTFSRLESRSLCVAAINQTNRPTN